MESAPATLPLATHLAQHRHSVAALGPEPRAFFLRHGYTLSRLARRNRVSPQMMQLFFAGGTVSGRLVRNLTKLRAQLEARASGYPAVEGDA